MPKPKPAPSCPNANQHTPAPRPYLAWHLWAEQMDRTHTQHRCAGCGLYQIWTLRPDAPELPPIAYRIGHQECQCCDGETLGCGCRWHRDLNSDGTARAA